MQLTEAESRAIRKRLVDTKPSDVDIDEFSRVYSCLLGSVLHGDGKSVSRTTATDTLTVWLLRASQVDNVNVYGMVSAEDVEAIFNYVMDFWTDSGAALGNALKELFRKLLAFTKRHRDGDQRIKEWTARVMDIPKTLRVHYFMIEVLVKHVGGKFVLSKDPDYARHVLKYISSNALANPISKAMFAIFSDIASDMDQCSWVDSWAEPVRESLADDANRDHLLTYFLNTVLKFRPESFQRFVAPLESSNLEDENRLTVLIRCLQLGKDLNIDIQRSIDPDLIHRLLRHRSRSLRISAFSLITSSPKISQPIDHDTFDLVLYNLPNMLSEPDAGYRNQAISFLRLFIYRARAYAYGLDRDASRGRGGADSARSLGYIKQFLQRLVKLVQSHLQPGSPYHNRFTGTQIFCILIHSGIDKDVDQQFHEKNHIPFPFNIPIFTEKIVRLLVLQLTNNYEDVRVLTSEVLRMAPLPLKGLQDKTSIDGLASEAKLMVQGMREREGDGGARVIELVHRLYGHESQTFLETLLRGIEISLEQAESDLASAVISYPVHGYFASLKLILENSADSLDPKLFKKIVRYCNKAWSLVEHIICHDSPEGNLPEGMQNSFSEESEKLYGSLSQIISSYAWRSVKESVGLIQTLLDTTPSDMLSDSEVEFCGELAMKQLITVRHKGAFASVYPTFISCCRVCYRKESLRHLPKHWLHTSISSIRTQSQYITRRSGGLPYVMTAILIAERDPRSSLDETFQELLSIALLPATSSGDNKVELPQVHAFNCIKALLTESELSKYVTPLIDGSLELAIRSFTSDVWAIRNCAVMLYTALQARLFGKSDSKSPARLFFTKYKGLRGLLLDLLSTHVEYLLNPRQEQSHVETIYPVLVLLARLQAVDGYDGLEEFKPLVLRCLQSTEWKIREAASRSAASIFDTKSKVTFAHKMLLEATITAQNALHGHLLTLKELDAPLDSKLLRAKIGELWVHNPCNETRLLFVQLLCKWFNDKEALTEICEQEIERDQSDKLSSTAREVRKVCFEFILQQSQTGNQIAEGLLIDSAYEVQLSALDHILNFDMQGISVPKLIQLLKSEKWDRVRGAAIEALLIPKHYQGINTDDLQLLWRILIESTGNSSTYVNEPSLKVLGALAASQSVIQKSEWIKIVRSYAHERNAYPTRLAALISLGNFISAAGDTSNIAVLALLWEFASDDDPELRDIATVIIESLLGMSPSAVPYAEQGMFKHIKSLKDEASAYFQDLLMSRGTLDGHLDQTLTENLLLFSVERDNLYMDYLAQTEEIAEIIATGELTPQFVKWCRDGKIYLNSLEKLPSLLGRWTSAEAHLAVFRIEVLNSVCDKFIII